MYEKEHDYGNVWAQKELEAKMKREGTSPFVINHPTAFQQGLEGRYTNPLLPSKTYELMSKGAREFESHEDVIAKLLGSS